MNTCMTNGKKKLIGLLISRSLTVLLFLCVMAGAGARDNFAVQSPDGRVAVNVTTRGGLRWSIKLSGKSVLEPSPIALETSRGSFDGSRGVRRSYESDENGRGTLRLTFTDGYSVEWRVWNDAAAYRILLPAGKQADIKNETAEFRFAADNECIVPYVNDNRGGERWSHSFEAYYDRQRISQLYADSLIMTPAAVCTDGTAKAVIFETGVENYPGMYLVKGTGNSLRAVFPPLPVKTETGGFNRLNIMPVERGSIIAGRATVLPWRIVMVAEEDRQLIGNDITKRLGTKSRIADTSWIRPGKAAWDWWNDWMLTGVPFRAGINNDTYKYYIDFASRNHLEYAVIDEGWSDPEDLMKPSGRLDIGMLTRYAAQRGVGIILWSSWRNMVQRGEKVMNDVMAHYAGIGVRGFKVDFFDRDDQTAVNSAYAVAKAAAAHKLVLDLHGFKPNGIEQAWPNILNFEGVKGLENSKWELLAGGKPLHDQPRYDVTIPFLRNLIGPMDYTPGAMTNAVPSQFRGNNSHPMSQGTRVHQMAMYTVFYSPLEMLADSPSKYMHEQECTDFIDSIPTVWDETIALGGEMGEYAAVARRHGRRWFVAAMTNSEARDIVLDLGRLRVAGHEMTVFADGINADRDATDYSRSASSVPADGMVMVHMAPGGGWTARIE